MGINLEKNIATTLTISREDWEKVGFFADKLGISKSALCRNIIRAGLDDLQLLNAVGAISLSAFIRKRRESRELMRQVKADQAKGYPEVDFDFGPEGS